MRVRAKALMDCRPQQQRVRDCGCGCGCGASPHTLDFFFLLLSKSRNEKLTKERGLKEHTYLGRSTPLQEDKTAQWYVPSRRI